MAILTREDSTNFSLLLARPEIEVNKYNTNVRKEHIRIEQRGHTFMRVHANKIEKSFINQLFLLDSNIIKWSKLLFLITPYIVSF